MLATLQLYIFTNYLKIQVLYYNQLEFYNVYNTFQLFIYSKYPFHFNLIYIYSSFKLFSMFKIIYYYLYHIYQLILINHYQLNII